MPTADTHPKVFISYSHDSLEHSDRVRELSDRLRADGIDCILDQYEVSPPEGWPRWMDNQISEADFVVMICTKTYYLRVMGKEKPGAGLGVRWEGNLIYQHIYDAETVNTKFIPVLLESGDIADIPKPWRGVARYLAHTEEGYVDLYRRLTDQPEHQKPVLGNVRDLGGVQKLQSLAPKKQVQDFFATSLTNLPFERNPFFTGREKLLNDLHAAFAGGGKTQAISGLGGLGKTQTAIEYAYRHRGDYQAIFWVRADSQLALSTGFVEIARLLNLPEKDAQNPDDAARAVRAWLESNPGWLLICDNADQPELVKEFRPRNAQGHTLLTSRAQVFDALGIAKPFEIDVMSREEAVKFLFTRTGRDDDNAVESDAATQVAEELGRLPLALEQAGAFITAKKARFKDYLVSYRKRKLALLNEMRPVTGDYPESVATTWSINFGEVEKVSAASSDLLRVSAFLSPDNIPYELITKGKSELGDALSNALVDVDDDPLALNNVLEPLTRYSFIRLDPDSQTYSIHRLVQEVLKDGMDEDTQSLWAERTVRALNEAFPEVEFRSWTSCRRLLPHAKAGASLIEKWDIALRQAARLLNQAAYYSYKRGQYSEAESLYLRALAIDEKRLGPDDLEVAIDVNNLGLLYHAQGRYLESKSLSERSLVIREKALGPDDVLVAVSLNNLAFSYLALGQTTEAEPLLSRSLAIRQKALKPDDPNLGTALNNLAALYRVQGKYAEAQPLYEHSLRLREMGLGSDHPDVAQTLNNLALLHQGQEKHEEAESLFRRSLAISERALGPDHPDVAQGLYNLADLYRILVRYNEAEPLLKRSLAIFETALGAQHPNVASILETYAAVLRAMKRNDEASEMETRAKAIRSK